jgi:hypothetical protein
VADILNNLVLELARHAKGAASHRRCCAKDIGTQGVRRKGSCFTMITMLHEQQESFGKPKNSQSPIISMHLPSAAFV